MRPVILIEFSLATTAENRARCVAALTKQMQVSRVEPGCVTYRFTADLEDPLVFHLLELWQDEEVLAAHMKTPAFAAFVPEMLALCQPRASVARSGPLEPYDLRLGR
jgi:quinol monooxygenase YgiN